MTDVFANDFTVIIGNSHEQTFNVVDVDEAGAETPPPAAGSTWIFRAVKGRTELLRLTSADAIDNDADGVVVVFLTAAQTRLIPKARTVRYELERRWTGVGGRSEERTYSGGYITGIGGDNDDAD